MSFKNFSTSQNKDQAAAKATTTPATDQKPAASKVATVVDAPKT